VRSWASRTLLGASRRDQLVRVGLAVVVLGTVLWALPTRRPGEEGHHAHHPPPALDPFERAGVTELTEGQRGPAFTLTTLDGRRVSLEDFRDRLVVLNFWATWCTPCTIEMPTLESLWRTYRDRALVVIGVSMDRGAPRGLIDPYVANLGLSFPIVLDHDGQVASAWRVSALPVTFIVRPGGEVAGLAVGMREWDSAPMRALLEAMLPGSPVPPPPPGRPGGEALGPGGSRDGLPPDARSGDGR
jgi:peroxiredoxin